MAAISAAGGTDALASAGCTAADTGSLNVDLSAGASVTRELALDAGDTLGITASGASATLHLGRRRSAHLDCRRRRHRVQPARVASRYLRAAVFRRSRRPATIRISCTSAQSAAADAAFLARRNDLVKAQEPDRIRLDRSPTPIANADKPLASTVDVDEEGRPRQVAFSVSLSEITAAAGQKPQPGLVDLWLEGRMQNYAATAADLGPGNGNLGILYFGTRSMIGPDILVGALAQLDRGVETARYAPAEIAASGLDGRPLSQHAAAERRHFRRSRGLGRDGERRPRR